MSYPPYIYTHTYVYKYEIYMYICIYISIYKWKNHQNHKQITSRFATVGCPLSLTTLVKHYPFFSNNYFTTYLFVTAYKMFSNSLNIKYCIFQNYINLHETEKLNRVHHNTSLLIEISLSTIECKTIQR